MDTVTLGHWQDLQQLIRSEHLELANCRCHSAQSDKEAALRRLEKQHWQYYSCQLGMRQEREHFGDSRTPPRKELAKDAHEVLGDATGAVQALVLTLRRTPKAFNMLLSHIQKNARHIDLLQETVIFSFFEDLVNPETSELDLLQVLRDYIHSEVLESPLCEELFTDLDSSLLGRLLVLYTQRRSQRKFIKMILKQTLIRIINTEDRVLSLDVEEAAREVMSKRRLFFDNSKTWPRFPTRSQSSPVMLDLDDEVTLLLSQTADTLRHYTLLVLDAIYSRLDSMPFPMRWLCRALSQTILRRGHRNTVQDRNRTLGTWEFSRWILTGIQRADLSGLLWDEQVTESNIANFSLIGRVIRHIYSETRFAEPKLEELNAFIRQEMYVIRYSDLACDVFSKI